MEVVFKTINLTFGLRNTQYNVLLDIRKHYCGIPILKIISVVTMLLSHLQKFFQIVYVDTFH